MDRAEREVALRACLKIRLESRLQAVGCGNRLKAGLQTLPQSEAGIFQTRSQGLATV